MEEQVTNQLYFAGFFRRLIATVIDGLVYLVAFQVILLFVAHSSVMSYVLGNFIGAVYYIFCLISPWQATIGKRLMNVFIQTKTANKLTVGRAFLRLLITSVPIIPISLITLFHPGMPALQQAFLSEDYYRIQQAMQEYAGLITMLNLSTVFMAIILPVWFLPVAFTKQRIGVHDMMCGTRAIRGRIIKKQ